MPRSKSRERSPETVSSELAREGYWSKLRLVGVALLCATVTLVPLIFDASLDMPFVVPKALLSHALAYVLAALMAGFFMRFGASFFVRSWLHVPVLAFVLTSALSAFMAVDPTIALYGTHARMLGLASTLDFVVFYFAIVLFVRTRLDALLVAFSALAASGVVLGYEALQLLGKDPFSWSVETSVRPFSTFGHPTVLAEYLAVVALGGFACGLLLDGLRFRVRAALVCYAALLLAGSAATATRSVLIGLGIGGAILVLLTWRLHPNASARKPSLLAAGAAVVVCAGLLLFSPLGARLAATIDSPSVGGDEEVLARLEPSAAGRVALYQIGLDEVRARPILGWGPDNFIVGVPTYRPERAPEVVRQNVASSAHSWVVQVATSSGLIGLGFFTAIGLTAVILAWRSGFRPIAIAGVATLAAFLGTSATTVSEIGTEWMFWASAGAIAASTARAQRPGWNSGTNRGTKRTNAAGDSAAKRVGIVALVSVAVALAALSGLSALDASRSARGSQQARLSGQAALAVDLGLRATRDDPRRAEYWNTLGLAYVSATNWREAVVAFDRARVLAPYDARYSGDLITALLILANAGDASARASAVVIAERSVQTDANNPRTHLTRAVVMQVTGNLSEALRSVERALFLDPKSVNDRLYVAAVQVLLDSGRPTEAADVARRGLAILGPVNRSVAIRIELARALAASGQPLDAIQELDLALSIQPNNVTLRQLKSQIEATRPR